MTFTFFSLPYRIRSICETMTWSTMIRRPIASVIYRSYRRRSSIIKMSTYENNVPVVPNKFHGQAVNTDMSRDKWNQCWETGITDFHKEDKHEFLVDHLDTLLNGRQSIKIFFPLCGKAVDMKWLYDLGHTIIGVEGAQKPVEEFFNENHIEHTVDAVDSVKGLLYQSSDRRMIIYFCDIYDFSSSAAGQFDAIWDRGSFGAINKLDRARYATLLLSLMAPGCRCLMECFSFNETRFVELDADIRNHHNHL
ncbi:hypothetical protein LSH36_203g00006 [Paralvinella palmiformis]|uniref:thiopurine S-methyltransferase n=1 Tax=Paralvinella palmiformis TaxID=53620 RepID=A0AAD9JP79_9ANNE|nr:hypothetical protein LSH36_203g00006 [Paralvinella palmiformis]